MPKTIVTHLHPDLDAIMATWLFVRFDQSRYGDAKLEFVPAGETYKHELVDSDNDVVHVDVGRGAFDHHQLGAPKTCAAKLVYEYLVNGGQIDEDDEAVSQMVDFAYEIDHFEDLYWPDSNNSRYAFMLHEIIPALHSLQIYDNEAVARMVFTYLDATYQRLKEWVKGKEELEEGDEFESAWGKGIAVVGDVDDLSKQGQRMGYKITVIYNPKKRYFKVKTAPHVTLDLKVLYDKIIIIDSPESWYYHNSGHILLTGSDKGATKPPSKLTVEQLLEIIKSIKG